MKPVRAGKLWLQVTLQNLVETIDSYGQPIQTWTDLQTFRADVQPLQGRELLNVRQVWATANYIVRFRYNSPASRPSPKQRFKIVKDNRILNILSIIDVEEQNRIFEAVCEESVQ